MIEDDEQAEEEASDGSAAGDAGAAGGGGNLSFWGVASVLTATVKAKTAEVLTAVQDTDWRAELEAFQQVGAGSLRSTGRGGSMRERLRR